MVPVKLTPFLRAAYDLRKLRSEKVAVAMRGLSKTDFRSARKRALETCAFVSRWRHISLSKVKVGNVSRNERDSSTRSSQAIRASDGSIARKPAGSKDVALLFPQCALLHVGSGYMWRNVLLLAVVTATALLALALLSHARIGLKSRR